MPAKGRPLLGPQPNWFDWFLIGIVCAGAIVLVIETAVLR